MKSQLVRILLFVLLFLPTFLYVFSIAAFEMDNHNIININDNFSEAKDENRNLNNTDFITKMTLLVMISFAIFTFFIALNIFNSNKNLKDAKLELLKLESEYKKLKDEKETIVSTIEKDMEKLFKEFVYKYKTYYKIEEIQELLLKIPLNKKLIYIKLSDVIENIDISNAYIVTKCTEAFPNDQDFFRLANIALTNISEKSR